MDKEKSWKGVRSDFPVSDMKLMISPYAGWFIWPLFHVDSVKIFILRENGRLTEASA